MLGKLTGGAIMMFFNYIFVMFCSVTFFTIDTWSVESYHDLQGNVVYKLNVADVKATQFNFNDYHFDIELNQNDSVYLCYIDRAKQQELINWIKEGISKTSSSGDVGILKRRHLFEIFKRSRRRGPMDFYSHLGAINFCQAKDSERSLTFYDDDIPNGEMLVVIQIKKDGPKLVFNKHDFGNFLWGASMRLIGISKVVAKSGAHINSKLFGSVDNSTVKKGEFDSKSDQSAIGYGYQWAKQFK